jgi:hypothetical protein
MSFSLGNRACEERPATIHCVDRPVLIEPGTCTVFENSCFLGRWAHPHRPDGLVLAPTAEQRRLFGTHISLRTTRVGDEVVRSVCATADAPHIVDQAVPFLYIRNDGEYGRAHLNLTIASRLTLNASASPSSIAVGDTSQLLATVSGGVPPYFYSWSPSSRLDDQDIAAPIANPTVTTTYTVGVSDSIGQQAVSEVTVHVRERLNVTANPESIPPGNASQLEAHFEGGTPPYTYSWTPIETLDRPLAADPVASPTTTTTYHVTVTDATGETLNGSATVTVAGQPSPLRAQASARPSSINFGETSQLDVFGSGGVPPYTYSWNESNTTNSLSDRQIQRPIASPQVSTFYEVTVTDSFGATATDNVAVTVVGSPPPTASFVFNVLCCPTLHLDASASTGEIVSYTWDLGWTLASPDLVTSSPTASFTIREFDRGTIRLTVADTAGRTATVTRNF